MNPDPKHSIFCRKQLSISSCIRPDTISNRIQDVKNSRLNLRKPSQSIVLADIDPKDPYHFSSVVLAYEILKIQFRLQLKNGSSRFRLYNDVNRCCPYRHHIHSSSHPFPTHPVLRNPANTPISKPLPATRQTNQILPLKASL